MGRSRRQTTLRSPAVVAASLLSVFATNKGCCNAGWVDPDTPEEGLTTTSFYDGDTRQFKLVFSDEFNQDGRTFEDGADPRWTALDKNDYTNEALHFYSSENVKTTNGVLQISTIQKDNKYKAFNEKILKFYSDSKHIQTGMVQGWNKFCMTGGIVEFNAKLPGDPKTGGLWPALWMLGNLARATFVGSSNYVWPYSYNVCEAKNRESQKISACTKVGHYGMRPGVGRGSPEIDVLEAMGGSDEQLPSTNVTRPYFSTSLQIAPGVDGMRPILGKLPKKGYWYEGLEYGNKTQLNPFFYGVTLIHEPKQLTYQSDAISANTPISKAHFTHHHKYRVEWEPPDVNGIGGHLKWYMDGEFLYGIHGKSLKLTHTEIPSEPMYLIMNTAVASSWGFPKPCPVGCDCSCFRCGDPDCMCGLPEGFCENNFPAYFEIDYVRAYQAVNESRHVLGCSTERRPTARFIEGHKKDYSDIVAGQKEPLLPIQHGGAACSIGDDCGAPLKGECSGYNRCVCKTNFTGPKCLTHAGFDDIIRPEYMQGVEIDMLYLSPAFTAMFAFAFLAFILFVGIAVLRKKRAIENYELIPSDNVMRQDGELVRAMQQGESGSYQQSGGGLNRMGANEQKTVTYCMIDGRLIDE